MNEMEKLRELLESLMNQEVEVDGRVGFDEDLNLLVEVRSGASLIALEVEVEEDSFIVQLMGGFRDDERFELEDVTVHIRDEVDALVELAPVIADILPDIDIELIKHTIHKQWIAPDRAFSLVEEQRIKISAEGMTTQWD